MSRKLLVISGKLKHGKDTFAKYIIEYCCLENKDFKIKTAAFANPIKVIAKTMFPQIPRQDLWGPSENRSNIVKDCINEKTKEPLIVRDVLTFIGNWGRSCNKNCWVNCTFDYISEHFDCNFVISDGRFLNELEFSKKKGAKIIRIIRPDVVSTSTDESEINLDNVPLNYYDAVVYNTSLQELKEEAKKIANMYILR